MPTATQGMSDQEINALNLYIRQQPWYEQWFQQRGLNPNYVRLNDQQRRDLERVAAQNGQPLGDRMKIDEAGNINQKGGWAGMPTWAKVAIGAGAAVATGGTLGALGAFGGAGSGVGAGGLGSGMNAATAGAAAHAGSPLLMGSGALLPVGAAAGAGSAEALLAGIPTTASRSLTNGMGTGPASLMGTGAAVGGANAWNAAGNAAGNGVGNALANTAKNALTDDGGVPDWLKAVIGGLSGLPALMAKQGPSDEERAFQDQARRLLAQQEQRTQFQNPLYSYITKSVYGLQPGTNGAQYPYNSLDDVKIPGMS